MITHKHHIIPRHAGGSDDPSNIVTLTIPEHAEAHKKLFEEHGRWQDEVAYLTLSGQIDKAEANIRAVRKANTGIVRSEETKKKIALSQVGNKNGKGNKGKPKSEEHKKNMKGNQNAKGRNYTAPWNIGKPLSAEHKRKISETKRKKYANIK
jgi:hypothetical protein